jgi:hypothetical protein
MSLKKTLKKLKKYFKKNLNFKIDLLMQEVFFSKNKNFPWKFARGKRIQGARSYAIRV